MEAGRTPLHPLAHAVTGIRGFTAVASENFKSSECSEGVRHSVEMHLRHVQLADEEISGRGDQKASETPLRQARHGLKPAKFGML